MKQTIQLSDHFSYGRLIRFTLPSIGMMIFTSIYGVVDGYFVSNFAGKTPFAAVNLIFPLLMILSTVGFIEGEGAVQPAGVADGVWGLFCLFPAAGFLVALVLLLLLYKLRSRDVQIMSQYNNGQISQEEAEALLADKYGPAGK